MRQTKTAAVIEPIQILLLTTKQTAEALQVSERTVVNLIASGQLPSVKVGGARRVSSDDLRAFAKAGVQEIAK